MLIILMITIFKVCMYLTISLKRVTKHIAYLCHNLQNSHLKGSARAVISAAAVRPLRTCVFHTGIPGLKSQLHIRFQPPIHAFWKTVAAGSNRSVIPGERPGLTLTLLALTQPCSSYCEHPQGESVHRRSLCLCLLLSRKISMQAI